MPTLKKTIQRPWQPERKAQSGRIETSSFYNTRRWRNSSKRFKRENPLCAHCLAKGLYVQGTVTDHIQRVRGSNDIDPFDESNWQNLCKKCHASKSGKEAHDGK